MRNKPVCPHCGEKGDVDSQLKCGVCGNQLEYADSQGGLKAVQESVSCPRCKMTCSLDSQYCESCGAVVGKYCDYCKVYHYIESPVCPKTGEPFNSAKSENSSAKRLITSAVVLLILLIGAWQHVSSKKGAPQGVMDTPLPIVVSNNNNQGNAPRIDVVFTVDTTCSMGDEIQVVQSKMKEMIRTIASGQPKPYVRYGLVAYRDRGDEYVTKKFELTDNYDEIISHINSLAADGGGDTPESVNEAMHVSVSQMNWDPSANTRKMIFLIGDAEPHMNYPNDYDYRVKSAKAREMEIKIHAIGCSGITFSGEKEFREMAQITGGTFEYLTYRQDYVMDDGSEVKVLKAGDKTYEVTGGAEDEWKEGYGAMERKKQAKPISDVSEITAGKRSAGGAPMAPPAPKGELRNNLDEVLIQQVQKEAEELNVRYSK